MTDPSRPNRFEENVLKVEIFYAEFNFENIKEKAAYAVSILLNMLL